MVPTLSDVSVLTIVRDRPAHFANLVEGLVRSSALTAQLVVVDMSAEPLTMPVAPFAVTMLRLDTGGLPLAAARNLAAAAATGTRLVFLDVDCIPLHGCLARLAAVLSAEDALLCADVRYLGPDDARGGWCEAGLLRAGTPHPVRDFPTAGVRREDNPGLFWSLAFAIRRSRFAALGGFDEGFTGYGAEDTDFGFRAAAADVPLLFVGGAIACHQHHAVYEPPLQHFADIVRNARRFHTIWGVWPMHGWLDAFADLGLVTRDAHTLHILRAPTAAQIAASRRS